MTSSFPSRVPHIQPNSPVSAGNAGAADRVLEQRTNHLLDRMDTIAAGDALVLQSVAVESDAQVGMVVYWNADNSRYERALAAAVSNPTTGVLEAAATADAIGMIVSKYDSTTADLVTHGQVSFESLAAAFDGEIEPGIYYLSPTEPGKLVASPPAATVDICRVLGSPDACNENIVVHVTPRLRNFLKEHIHYTFDLTALPAGDHTPPSVGERHEITNADAEKPGWLPADHETFNGTAPQGAVFGYNLSQHPELQQHWPPTPADAALLGVQKEDSGSSPELIGYASPDLVQFDHYGIWWMTDCYDEVPWPVDYETGTSESSLSSAAGDCTPVPTTMWLRLSFVQMVFLTEHYAVTSLQPADGQPLQFVDRNGQEATRGDLYAKLLLALLIEDESYGGQVLKGIGTDNTFQRGWATEGLIAGSDNVVITSTHQRYLDPEDSGSAVVHQGIATVDVPGDPTDREVLPQITTLGDATERLYKNMPYYGLLDGRDCGLRFEFAIPAEGLPADPKLVIRTWVFGRGNGTMTDLETSYYRLIRPTAGTPTPLTEGDTPLTLDTDIEVVADEVHEIDSEQIDIAAGDIVFVSIDRGTAGLPAYAAEMGLIRVTGVIVAGS